MRKLATVREVSEIFAIEGADAIEGARIDGWEVVVKKGEFKAGDLAVYFEIDSWVPECIAPFLSKGREYEGVAGSRLKTVKLRGQVSQGLLMPLSILGDRPSELGDDVTEPLGVLKWEAPEVNVGSWGTRGSRPRGNFPAFLRKTDQERVQNMAGKLWHPKLVDNMELWEVTEKLDGTSLTVYHNEQTLGVCSRNLDLKEEDGGLYWQVAKDSGALAFIERAGDNYAIQGEIVGPGVQKNPYKLDMPTFYVFDVFNISRGEYLLPEERKTFLQGSGLNHVPVLRTAPLLDNLKDTLADAEAKSLLNSKTEREGVVWKSTSKGASFKAISNKFLLKEK